MSGGTRPSMWPMTKNGEPSHSLLGSCHRIGGTHGTVLAHELHDPELLVEIVRGKYRHGSRVGAQADNEAFSLPAAVVPLDGDQDRLARHAVRRWRVEVDDRRGGACRVALVQPPLQTGTE